MSSSAQELLRRHGIAYMATRNGRYTTRCPWCSGPYLNVKVDNDGACWFCRDCQQGGPKALAHPDPPQPNNGLGPIREIYDYQDELGGRRFQVLRLEPANGVKRFFQRTGPEQGKWSIKGVRRVPFMLPELIEAIVGGFVVFVVEGEKDVLTLRHHNIPATTNPMGAGNWLAEFNPFFAGADVVICGDNDAAGRDHVRLVAANLAPVVERLRVLDLANIWPDIGPSNDISDWFAHGCGTVEALWAAVEQLPHYVPAGDKPPADDEPPPAEPPPESKPEPAPDNGPEHTAALHIGLADFVALMPMHRYIFKPAGDLWPATSVNARVPPVAAVDASGQPVLDEKGKQKFLPASAWLDRNQPVEQMTWSPGEPPLIANKLIAEGGWIKQPGCTVFNLYRPPNIIRSGAGDPEPWLQHVRKVFPDDADHIVQWFAHRVQRPQEKINHALVLTGDQGIGKDTLVEPVKYAVGSWNCSEVSPRNILGRFSGYLKCVILRISEARDLGDIDRFAFYDHMKKYIAAPPDVLRVDEKNLREYYIPNLCGVVITSNHKSDGIYLPADDRRHYVACSSLTKEDFEAGYWAGLYRYYADGGNAAVAAHLAGLDLSSFDAKAPPPKTAAFWNIVDAHRAPEDAELADVLDGLKNPDATTIKQVQLHATGDFGIWINDRKNRRQIAHRFESCGYVAVHNDSAKDGLWVINHERQVIYAKASLSVRDQLAAASKLLGKQEKQ
jgi:hypothetical protein